MYLVWRWPHLSVWHLERHLSWAALVGRDYRFPKSGMTVVMRHHRVRDIVLLGPNSASSTVSIATSKSQTAGRRPAAGGGMPTRSTLVKGRCF